MEKIWPCLLGILTLLLLLSGAFSPGWLVLDLSTIDELKILWTSTSYIFHFGLFYLLIVGDGFSEASDYGRIGFLSKTPYFTLGMLEYQIEVCIGIALVFISLIMTWTYNKDRAASWMLVPIIMYLVACVVTLVAVGRFLSAVIILGNKSGVPYSLILSGLGGLFCFVLMVLLIVMIYQRRRAHLQQQGVIYTDRRAHLPPHQGVIYSDKRAHLPPDQGVIYSDRRAHLPPHQGVISSDRRAHLPSHQGLISSDRRAHLPSHQGLIYSVRRAHLPSYQGVIYSDRRAHLPPDQGVIYSDRRAHLLPDQGVIYSDRRAHLPPDQGVIYSDVSTVNSWISALPSIPTRNKISTRDHLNSSKQHVQRATPMTYYIKRAKTFSYEPSE